MKKKTLALLAALVLVIGCIIGGTLAWLTAKSDVVTNTFTTSDINIKLEETKGTAVTGGKEFKMIPGYSISKDPKATVVAGSEECFLFVKLEKSANFNDYMTYEIADDWKALTGVDGVYYRKVHTADMGNPYSVLKDDQVTVKDTVTKSMMNGLTEDTYPKLTITAYASQLHKNATTEFTAAEAWAKVNPTNP